MEIHLSEAEQVFIIHGIQEGIRNDGRGLEDYRPMVLETDVLSNTTGSSRLRIGNTDVLVGVKAEIEAPLDSMPNKGRIQFFVDCSANATPEFEGRGGEDISQGIGSALTDAFNNEAVMDLAKLCIVPKTYCWVLYIDIVLLECGGNLYDAVSVAVFAALRNTRVPNVTATYNAEKDQHDIDLTDDHFDFWHLDAKCLPLLVTVSKIGFSNAVDVTMEEESCCKSSTLVAVLESGDVTFIRQQGRGSLDPESVTEMLELAVRTGQRLNKVLVQKLVEEETKPKSGGFLT